MYPRKPSRTAPFVSGLVLGILAALFLPGYVKPYLPQWAKGKEIAVKGTVTAKQKIEKAVLLTVNTPEGVLLATFKKKVDEINLLVNEKDTIELTVEKYAPFIDDPKIMRVAKEEPAPPAAVPEVIKPKEKSAKEAKPKRQEKPQAAEPPAPAVIEKKPQPASPAPSTTEVKPPAGSPAPGTNETKPAESK